ncbi:hypothetical protein JXA88_01585 [Candidatus Fermentibacteria bacterium]|nr:hypothetical protein [Candidatus Fermentibacteria bacterium]
MHRVGLELELLGRARVIVVTARREEAWPTGVARDGIASLLTTSTWPAAGKSVVDIDNGIGD